MGIQEDILHFEQSLAELIIKYEQYFLGIEKREPVKLLAQVERAARCYVPGQIINTMLKFKFNSTVAKLNSYKQYWTRINRLIEDGKYSRERFKMERHLNHPDPHPEHVRPAVVGEIDAVYQQYLAARQQCHLSTDGVSREYIAAFLEKQKPLLKSKYHCDVEFVVVVQDGAPKIKARPKK